MGKNNLPRGLEHEIEEWRDIPGYEGLYQISSSGKVKSLPKYHSKKDRILKGNIDKDGYIKVRLCLNPRTRKAYFVHRLVAIAFISNEKKFPEIDHINTIKSDNRVENLRWCEHKINMNNEITVKKRSLSRKGIKFSAETIKKMSEAKKGKKLPPHVLSMLIERKQKPVKMVDGEGNTIAVFKRIKEAGDIMGISPQRISDVCLNKRNKAGGYKWERA